MEATFDAQFSSFSEFVPRKSKRLSFVRKVIDAILLGNDARRLIQEISFEIGWFLDDILAPNSQIVIWRHSPVAFCLNPIGMKSFHDRESAAQFA
ncbi:hypothetical protein [uncultured Sunxiuqinia sp.]|uniref:hypothetical protein n=1 Tax=uncultured Sunxiuqinia sp. TaxID=1573825 RepID=UPI0030DABBFE